MNICNGYQLECKNEIYTNDLLKLCHDLCMDPIFEGIHFKPSSGYECGIEFVFNEADKINYFKCMRIYFEKPPRVTNNYEIDFITNNNIVCSEGYVMDTCLENGNGSPAWTFDELKAFSKHLNTVGMAMLSF